MYSREDLSCSTRQGAVVCSYPDDAVEAFQIFVVPVVADDDPEHMSLLKNKAVDQASVFRVQSRGGLIKQHDPGLSPHRAGYADPLPFPAGNIVSKVSQRLISNPLRQGC